MNVAELILQVLKQYDVKQIFGIPGDAINEMTNALRQQEDIRFVQVRHEESGALAASAQAKLSDRLAVCMGTAGPGAIHLLNGLYDAQMDHAPVLAITGQVESYRIGTDYHQEVDLERLFRDVAIYSQTINTEDQLPAVIQEACRAAVSARGVAHVCVPADIAGKTVIINDDRLKRCQPIGRVLPDMSVCKAALEWLNGTDKITILAGIGCRNAVDELRLLADSLCAPIVRTLRAKDIIDDTDELCVGGTGMLGGQPGLTAMEDCDLLLLLGTDFPYPDYYPTGAKVIQIDNVATRLGKRQAVDLAMLGDIKPTLQELLKHIDKRANRAFLEKSQNDMVTWFAEQEQKESSNDTPIKPQRLLRELSAVAPNDAIFVSDTGTVNVWSARHLRVRPDQRYTLSSALGSMGFALPGAIGAQLTYPEKQVIALAGDGGFTMLMQEFVTAVHEALPLVVVILNNGKLGFIGLEQQAKGMPRHSINIPAMDFAGFARACGGTGFQIDNPKDLTATLTEALECSKPCIVDVSIAPDELIVPAKIQAKDVLNYGVAQAREMLGQS